MAKATKPAKRATKKRPAKKPPAKKSPAKKPPAKKQPAKKQPAKKPAKKLSAAECVELARKGDLDALWELVDGDSSSDNDRDVYKWLNVASDFGHEEADDMIGDVLEVTSMRYDDDRYETAAAHWELGAAYLHGADGLPVDLKLAKKHLTEALGTHKLEHISAGCAESYDPEPLLKKLTGDAKKLLQSALAGELGSDDDDEDDEDDE